MLWLLLFVSRRVEKLATIGRVSPRRASDFCGDEKVTKKRPAAAPARAVAPRSTCVRRVASKLALAGLRHRRQFPPAAGSTRRCRRGKAGSASPLPAVGRLRLGRGIRKRFVAPAKAGFRALILAVWLWVLSVGDDWRVSPRRATTLLWRQERWIKRALPQRRLGRPGCARQGNVVRANCRFKVQADGLGGGRAGRRNRWVRRFRGEQSCIRPAVPAVRDSAYALRRRIAPT